MEIKDFIEKFAEVFDEVAVEELAQETAFKELDEWDSLMALSIIAMVDEEYGITIKGDDISKSNTIVELFEKVQNLK